MLPQALFGCCRLVPSWNVNSLFESEGVTCASKCIRKVALCHIEQEEYAQASAVIRLCPGDEAATHYLTFLVAVKQGKKYLSGLACHGTANSTDPRVKGWENDGMDQPILSITSLFPHDGISFPLAIQAIKDMVHGTCFDQRMLLVSTQLAHESDLKNVLPSVLQELTAPLELGRRPK